MPYPIERGNGTLCGRTVALYLNGLKVCWRNGWASVAAGGRAWVNYCRRAPAECVCGHCALLTSCPAPAAGPAPIARLHPPSSLQAWDKDHKKVVDNQVVAQYQYRKLPSEEIKVRGSVRGDRGKAMTVAGLRAAAGRLPLCSSAAAASEPMPSAFLS